MKLNSVIFVYTAAKCTIQVAKYHTNIIQLTNTIMKHKGHHQQHIDVQHCETKYITKQHLPVQNMLSDQTFDQCVLLTECESSDIIKCTEVAYCFYCHCKSSIICCFCHLQKFQCSQ